MAVIIGTFMIIAFLTGAWPVALLLFVVLMGMDSE